MQYIGEKQDRLDLGRSQRLANISFCNKEKLGGLFPFLEFP
jgi:hypothetical protein